MIFWACQRSSKVGRGSDVITKASYITQKLDDVSINSVKQLSCNVQGRSVWEFDVVAQPDKDKVLNLPFLDECGDINATIAVLDSTTPHSWQDDGGGKLEVIPV